MPHGSRSIYSWYLGFNTGAVTDFHPAPYARRQRGYVEAMGGPARVRYLAREAMADGDDKWAIELLGYLVRSDPTDTEARELSAAAHRTLGYLQHNATWRNWYLSAAEELLGRIPVATTAAVADIQGGLPLDSLVAGLPVRLRAELTWYVEAVLALTVNGPGGRSFTFHLRRGGARGRRRDRRRCSGRACVHRQGCFFRSPFRLCRNRTGGCRAPRGHWGRRGRGIRRGVLRPGPGHESHPGDSARARGLRGSHVSEAGQACRQVVNWAAPDSSLR